MYDIKKATFIYFYPLFRFVRWMVNSLDQYDKEIENDYQKYVVRKGSREALKCH